MTGRAGVRGLAVGAVVCAALAGPASASATSTSVYAADAGAGLSGTTVVQYSAGLDGRLNQKLPFTAPTGTQPESVAMTPDGRYAYVTNSATGSVSQFSIGAGGQLNPLSPASVTAAGARGIAIAPDGRSAYVTDQNTGTVFEFDIGAGGGLTPKSTPSIASVSQAVAIAVSPDGNSVYVADNSGVSQYDVGTGGILSPKSTPTIAAGSLPFAIAVAPDGGSVYVANLVGKTVTQYTVGAGGLLSPKSPATIATPNNPHSIAISPDGNSAYVTNNGGANGILQYDIGAGGLLAAKSPASVPAGTSPEGITVSPDGRSAYATDDNGGVWQFDIGAGGGLAAKSPASVTGGSDLQGIVVAPDQSPTASFTAAAALAGSATAFHGSGSTDVDGTIARYDWNFGDGTTLANGGAAPSHVYARPGTYTATLTVTDDGGCSTKQVFTGQTAYCSGSPGASTTRTVVVPAVASSISHLKASPKKFSLAGRKVNGKCVKPTSKNKGAPHCRRPIRLVISYTLDAASLVTFTVARETQGRIVNGRCVRRTQQNAGNKKCVLVKKLKGSLRKSGKAGHNRFIFKGTIGGRRLGLGTYQLTATPVGGAPKKVTFTIVA